MISFREKGNFNRTRKYLGKLYDGIDENMLKYYGDKGVKVLSDATPIDTGLTAKSWYYEITKTEGSVSISFYNSNIQNGVPIAIILQYGHGTRNGGWVEGRDYINPSIQPIFDEIANNAWKEVTKS